MLSSILSSFLSAEADLILAILSNHLCRDSAEFCLTSSMCFHASLSLFRACACERFSRTSIFCPVRAASFFPFVVTGILLDFDSSIDFHSRIWRPASVRSGDLYSPCCFCFTALVKAMRMDRTIRSSNLLYCCSFRSSAPCVCNSPMRSSTCFSILYLVKVSMSAVRKSPRTLSFQKENSRCWGGT